MFKTTDLRVHIPVAPLSFISCCFLNMIWLFVVYIFQPYFWVANSDLWYHSAKFPPTMCSSRHVIGLTSSVLCLSFSAGLSNCLPICAATASLVYMRLCFESVWSYSYIHYSHTEICCKQCPFTGFGIFTWAGRCVYFSVGYRLLINKEYLFWIYQIQCILN